MGTFADRIIDFNTHLNYEDALPEGFAVLNPYVDNPEAVRVMELFYRKFYNDNQSVILLLASTPAGTERGLREYLLLIQNIWHRIVVL